MGKTLNTIDSHLLESIKQNYSNARKSFTKSKSGTYPYLLANWKEIVETEQKTILTTKHQDKLFFNFPNN